MIDQWKRANKRSGSAQQSQFSTRSRINQPEWLDLGYGTQESTCENLEEMDRLNWITRGTISLLTHLGPRLRSIQGTARVLDLGTGSGALPAHLLTWAEKLALVVQIYGVDWAYRNLSCAETTDAVSARSARLLCANAYCLPFPPASVHYVISSLFLHHFSPPELIQILRAAYQVASAGIVMTDLVRGRAPLFAFYLAQPIFARNSLTRHDGALSIRRAYRPDELLSLAHQAGLKGARVYSHFPWRMTLVADK